MQTESGVLKIRVMLSFDLKWWGGRTANSNKMKPQRKLKCYRLNPPLSGNTVWHITREEKVKSH